MRYVPCWTLVLVAAASQAPGHPNQGLSGPTGAPTLKNGVVPFGSLGHAIGTYLTVEGVPETRGKVGKRTLAIDTVNGQKLAEPVVIWVDNLDLPAGRRCVLKGYESTRMIGAPPAQEQYDRERGRQVELRQSLWQVQMYFVALAVVAPEDLKIQEGP
jgi:hypothetical protein